MNLLTRTISFPFSVLRRLPPAQDGLFLAQAESVSPWYRWVRYSREIRGRRRAYLRARWEALKLDWGAVSPECGIYWSVRRL